MQTLTRSLTLRRPLDRTLWHGVRCSVGWHVKASWELREFVMSRKEGRKTVEFSVWANVQETICCGKSVIDRVL